MTFAATTLVAIVLQSAPEAAYEQAVAALEAGDPAAAEASAREALQLSLAFSPEEEIEARPDKGILFEDMILEARGSYLTKRVRYFRALGDALAAQERFRASRNAYRRVTALVPDVEILIAMADDPDLSIAERVDFLLDAYLTPGADRSALEKTLLDTGVFRSRDALKSSLDEKRFRALSEEYDALEWLPGSFPQIQAVTDAGTINTAQLFREGHLLIVYVPVDSCAHCSEQLDGLTVPVLEKRQRDEPVTLTGFVPELELPATRRIVRLLGMPVGVGRLEGLPPGIVFAEEGEIRVVARGGITQIRLPMSPNLRSGEIRREIEAVFRYLSEPGLPTEEKPEEASVPIVTLESDVNEQRMLLTWIESVRKLEAGPAPLRDFYAKLRQQTQKIVRASGDRDLSFEILTALGGLRGANAAKTRALAEIGVDIGDRLLAEVQALDPDVRRTAPAGSGVFFVDVSMSAEGRRRVVMQRSFQTATGLEHYNFVLDDTGTDVAVRFIAHEEDHPDGVGAVDAGSVFHYVSGNDCGGLRLVRDGEAIYENCLAVVLDGEVVEQRMALVEPLADGPSYYARSVVTGGEASALEDGLERFAAGDFEGAAAAFALAADALDEDAPYDASDLIYNRARALEEMGQRQEALTLYRSLGDVTYQWLVDEGAGRIEGAPR